MTPNELTPLLAEFYSDRLALLQRHVASARRVSDYDVNNAYQCVVAREETQLYWVHRALLDVGGSVPAAPPPDGEMPGTVKELAAADGRANQAFIEKWTPRVGAVDHARHRKMLQVILGELQEHRRMFEQAGDGRVDVIGTPVAGTVRTGAVLDRRWIE